MIAVAANDGRRPRYALGIAVAVLIVAAYVLVGSKPTAPASTPSPAPSVVSAVVPPSPSLIIPPVIIGPTLLPSIISGPPNATLPHLDTPPPLH